MTAAVFVDTDVLVCARDASEPEKQPASAQWLEQLWIEQRGRTGIQVDGQMTETDVLDGFERLLAKNRRSAYIV